MLTRYEERLIEACFVIHEIEEAKKKQTDTTMYAILQLVEDGYKHSLEDREEDHV